MNLIENDKFEKGLLFKNQDKKILREEILNEKLKKASILTNKMEIGEKLKHKKKQFIKLGLFLICIGIICLLIINIIPWAYVIYDNKTTNHKNNEIFYYNDKINNFSNDTHFSSFFDTKDSYNYLGLNSYTFKIISNTQSFILYTIITLGIIITILSLFIKRSDFPIEKYKLLHCFFAFITALLCIYLIVITVKFLGAEILLFYNGNFISDNIENLALIFISPIILIIITSIILKITFTILKINFNFFEKTFDEKKISIKNGVN